MESFFGFILYPVSAILWFWHKVFGLAFGPDSGVAWALAVFFLVFSLRVVLLKPALSQLRSGRKMQKFAPQMQKVREKHKNDRQKMAQEMQKLQSEHGVSPLGGCLPALLQIPVFLSLFRVLRDFQPGKPSNFVFNGQEVQSFVDASLFNAKLGNWITQPATELAKFGTTKFDMMVVSIPLMIVASVATFFTMRLSVQRQTDASMANPQSAMLGKVMMYIAPIGALISGWFLPLAVLLYWLANNFWTLGQQHFLTNKVDREQEREKAAAIAAKKDAPRPKPGQRPKQDKVDDESRTVDSEAEPAESEQNSSGGAQSGTKTSVNGKATTGGNGGKSNGQAGNRPGANKKSQQKNRPGKQAASAKKSQKKRR